MPNLPTTRQSQPSAAPPPRLTPKLVRRGQSKERAADRRRLADAFLTFTEAAGSLEKSYGHLQAEVGRLRADLECANAELSRSLEETSRVRVFLARVLEGLPCGVLVTDSAGLPRMLNPEARRLLNIDEDWNPPGDDWPPALLRLLAEVSPGSFQAEQEWTSETLAENRIIGISAAIADETPNVESETIWILRDVSQQKRLAAEREASRSAHALAEIATVLAHEIRNPLGSMELFTGLLASATAHMPEASNWVTHLQAGLRSLSATVNNVLQFHSQPCAEALPTSLNRLVRETADFLTPLARQRGLQIKTDCTTFNARVAGNAQRLQQVLFNLALNSFHAMSRGGTLTIRLVRGESNPSGQVQLDFQDEGQGMDAAIIEKIFEPGFTTKAGSPGLGLSVCRKVIEEHGGSITVSSRAPHGSTFSIFLPLLGEA